MKTIISLSAKLPSGPRRYPTPSVGGTRAVVPAESKEKISKLLAKKRELGAKYKADIKKLDATLKALGYKPAVAGRRLLIK